VCLQESSSGLCAEGDNEVGDVTVDLGVEVVVETALIVIEEEETVSSLCCIVVDGEASDEALDLRGLEVVVVMLDLD